jgi:hypothetical protein
MSVAAPRLPVHRQIERAELRLEQYRISLYLMPGDAKTKETVQRIEDTLAALRAVHEGVQLSPATAASSARH